MILDKFSNIGMYKGVSARLAKAIEYLESNDLQSFELGKYFIDSDEIYFMVNQYESKPAADCKPETHEKYIDIQIILEGEEQMGYRAFDGQATSVEYNPEKDVTFFTIDTDMIAVKKGMFAIFFPQDIHQPNVMLNAPVLVRKIVVKVLA
jgi:YhcH/YjgK/YiaL family protein